MLRFFVSDGSRSFRSACSAVMAGAKDDEDGGGGGKGGKLLLELEDTDVERLRCSTKGSMMGRTSKGAAMVVDLDMFGAFSSLPANEPGLVQSKIEEVGLTANGNAPSDAFGAFAKERFLLNG